MFERLNPWRAKPKQMPESELEELYKKVDHLFEQEKSVHEQMRAVWEKMKVMDFREGKEQAKKFDELFGQRSKLAAQVDAYFKRRMRILKRIHADANARGKLSDARMAALFVLASRYLIKIGIEKDASVKSLVAEMVMKKKILIDEITEMTSLMKNMVYSLLTPKQRLKVFRFALGEFEAMKNDLILGKEQVLMNYLLGVELEDHAEGIFFRDVMASWLRSYDSLPGARIDAFNSQREKCLADYSELEDLILKAQELNDDQAQQLIENIFASDDLDDYEVEQALKERKEKKFGKLKTSQLQVGANDSKKTEVKINKLPVKKLEDHYARQAEAKEKEVVTKIEGKKVSRLKSDRYKIAADHEGAMYHTTKPEVKRLNIGQFEKKLKEVKEVRKKVNEPKAKLEASRLTIGTQDKIRGYQTHKPKVSRLNVESVKQKLAKEKEVVAMVKKPEAKRLSETRFVTSKAEEMTRQVEQPNAGKLDITNLFKAPEPQVKPNRVGRAAGRLFQKVKSKGESKDLNSLPNNLKL